MEDRFIGTVPGLSSFRSTPSFIQRDLEPDHLFLVDLAMAKQVYECNWVPSRVTESQLDDLVLIGALDNKDTIHWRVPGNECPPTPQEGEVVVFADHLARGSNRPALNFTGMC